MQKAAVSVSAAASVDLDFDFQMPCRYFKSSFARSLSLNNNNNNTNGSGNGNGNSLTLPKKPQTNEAKQNNNNNSNNSEASLEGDSDWGESPCPTPPPALPARRHTANMLHFGGTAAATAAATTTTITANQLLSASTCSSNNHPPQQPAQQPQQSGRNLNLVWPMQQPTHQQAQQDANIAAAPIPSHHHHHHHVYDLPQQLQQQQQPQQQHQHHQHQQQQHQLNVEAVILQNQVDTLHWQLKQTETNCEMYRAVMEEVARFFDRYQQQQQLQATHRNGEQIARSKSLHHVHGVGNSSLQSDSRDAEDASSAGSASYLRARSSTNLMLNKSMHAMNEEHNYETIAPAGSYNAFKDFTWRRSPKKSGASGGCKARLSTPEAAEEKLNQEAFRLARTIRNLLHTSQQQPDLTQPRHSLASISSLPGGQHRLCGKGKTSSVMTLCSPPLHNSTTIMMETTLPAGKSHAELIFLRANNMRDSRLSLRSSTDSSVHSTISSTASSSSKVETDEETQSSGNSSNNTTPTTASNTAIVSNKPTTSNINKQSGSSTEDESGFSSISSFHDVGLPLSSTLLEGSERRLSMSSESRNSTLKSALNGVGVPLQSQNQSPSKTYRNANRYQRFSTLSNEDAAAVLWV